MLNCEEGASNGEIEDLKTLELSLADLRLLLEPWQDTCKQNNMFICHQFT